MSRILLAFVSITILTATMVNGCSELPFIGSSCVYVRRFTHKVYEMELVNSSDMALGECTKLEIDGFKWNLPKIDTIEKRVKMAKILNDFMIKENISPLPRIDGERKYANFPKKQAAAKEWRYPSFWLGLRRRPFEAGERSSDEAPWNWTSDNTGMKLRARGLEFWSLDQPNNDDGDERCALGLYVFEAPINQTIQFVDVRCNYAGESYNQSEGYGDEEKFKRINLVAHVCVGDKPAAVKKPSTPVYEEWWFILIAVAVVVVPLTILVIVCIVVLKPPNRCPAGATEHHHPHGRNRHSHGHHRRRHDSPPDDEDENHHDHDHDDRGGSHGRRENRRREKEYQRRKLLSRYQKKRVNANGKDREPSDEMSSHTLDSLREMSMPPPAASPSPKVGYCAPPMELSNKRGADHSDSVNEDGVVVHPYSNIGPRFNKNKTSKSSSSKAAVVKKSSQVKGDRSIEW